MESSEINETVHKQADHIYQARELVGELEFLGEIVETAAREEPVLLSCEDWLFTIPYIVLWLTEGLFCMVSLRGWPDDDDEDDICRWFGNPPRAKLMAQAERAGWDCHGYGFDPDLIRSLFREFDTLDTESYLARRWDFLQDFQQIYCGNKPALAEGHFYPINSCEFWVIQEPDRSEWDFVLYQDPKHLQELVEVLIDQAITPMVGKINGHLHLAGASTRIADPNALGDIKLLNRILSSVSHELDVLWNTFDRTTQDPISFERLRNPVRPDTAVAHLFRDLEGADLTDPGEAIRRQRRKRPVIAQEESPLEQTPPAVRKPKIAKALIDGLETFLADHPGNEFTAKELNVGLQEAGLTAKTYPASDISNAKRYLINVKHVPLVGRRYCYKPDKKTKRGKKP
ncbi:MAG: hypothetical protein GWP14_10430 [Actinobacteria bacterium]|nr:hypothetical protein [Actinomycetota bacterium]